MLKFAHRTLATFAIAATLLTFSVAPANAYSRNTAPDITSVSVTGGYITITWSKSAGKPTRWVTYQMHYGEFGNIAWNSSGKVPGSAGSKGFTSVPMSSTQCDAGDYIDITLLNGSGTDTYRHTC